MNHVKVFCTNYSIFWSQISIMGYFGIKNTHFGHFFSYVYLEELILHSTSSPFCCDALDTLHDYFTRKNIWTKTRDIKWA